LENHLPILKKCPLFAKIEDESLLQMLSCLAARVEHFEKKQTVLSEGAPAKEIGVVLSGEVQVLQVDYYGNRSILSNIGPGEMFAEAFACAETNTIPITVTASENTDVMLVDCSHILHICGNHCAFHQQLLYNLVRDLADKTVSFHRRIEITSKRTTREKLLAYLFLEAKKTGRSRFTIPFDRQELADFLEVDRSGLSAEISKLRREGRLECRKNEFRLLQ